MGLKAKASHSKLIWNIHYVRHLKFNKINILPGVEGTGWVLQDPWLIVLVSVGCCSVLFSSDVEGNIVECFTTVNGSIVELDWSYVISGGVEYDCVTKAGVVTTLSVAISLPVFEAALCDIVSEVMLSITSAFLWVVMSVFCSSSVVDLTVSTNNGDEEEGLGNEVTVDVSVTVTSGEVSSISDVDILFCVE